MDNHHLYLDKANEVCRNIFEKEYFNSLGIPLPEIKFIQPDSANFKSGEYYIRIGDTWQIHLNFGLLPTSLLEFAEEVKVLARHEIEHYQTCPFDVLTHFRMLKAIVDTYKSKYSRHRIDIDKLAPQLANQAADIVIDTHNFRRYPGETLKSEIEWIKKGGAKSFSELPRHAKLMFLTKQALWKADLKLDESDPDLLMKIGQLADLIDEGGVTNKDLFLSKTKCYTELFFELFQQDKKESSDSQQESQSSVLSSSEIIPSKDSQAEGSNFIFQSPDKISHAIEQFAQEAGLEEFQQIIDMAGIKDLSLSDKQRIWFEAQNINEIEIPDSTFSGAQDIYMYPEVWKIGDPIEDIDIMLTYTVSPIIIPGVTTKKWSKNPVFKGGSQKSIPDLLLVLDSSGSMGSLKDEKSNLFNAVKSCFGIIKYFEKNNSEVALINFSTKATINLWSKDYKRIKEGLLLEGGGNTVFPIDAIAKLKRLKKSNAVIVIITDGEIQNDIQALEILREHLLSGNKVFMFLQDKKGTIKKFIGLESYGAIISQAFTAKDIRNLVLNNM
ncbi:MAG: VWA domain-containing protein [Bacteroidetes bacterium]|nr:VWA domain-containing protein [Bacteroidota bacterium]